MAELACEAEAQCSEHSIHFHMPLCALEIVLRDLFKVDKVLPSKIHNKIVASRRRLWFFLQKTQRTGKMVSKAKSLETKGDTAS